MSRKSYQQEIPKARVNITLDFEKEGEALQQELPHKVLAMGNFSGHQTKAALRKRNPIAITPDSLDDVIAKLKPSLRLMIETNASDGQVVNLQFSSMKDFHPDQLVYQDPNLKKLIAMRQLLTDLRAQLIDNQTFKKALQSLLKSTLEAQEIRHATP